MNKPRSRYVLWGLLFFSGLVAGGFYLALGGPVLATMTSSWHPFGKFISQWIVLTLFIYAVAIAAYEQGVNDTQDDVY